MQVGSLVKCLSYPEPESICADEVIPKPGALYTVREIVQHKKAPGLRFEEIVNTARKYRDGFGEAHYGIEGFEEVQPPLDVSALFSDQLKVPNENRVNK